MPMAEVRPRILRGGVQVGALGVGGRYTPPVVAGVSRSGIFRGMSVTPPPVAARRVLSPEENKENIPPPPPEREGGRASRPRSRRKPNKKSPLPVWYPRTPLRDITAIVNVMEKRRNRLRAAAAARRSQSSGSPLPQESDASPSNFSVLASPSASVEQALVASSRSDDSVASDLPSLASPPPSVQLAFGDSSQAVVSTSPDLSPLTSPPVSAQQALSSAEETRSTVVSPKALEMSDSLLKDSSAVQKVPAVAAVRYPASGKNLVNNIDVIKKLIRDEQLRKKAAGGTVKPKPAKRSTLMSMR